MVCIARLRMCMMCMMCMVCMVCIARLRMYILGRAGTKLRMHAMMRPFECRPTVSLVPTPLCTDNVARLVALSALSAVFGEALGLKLQLTKLLK